MRHYCERLIKQMRIITVIGRRTRKTIHHGGGKMQTVGNDATAVVVKLK